MQVPVRRQPQTQISEQQRGFAQAAPALNVEPLTHLIEGFKNQLADEQDQRQRVGLNRELIHEVNGLQEDFAQRQTDPNVSPIDFAANTNTAYEQRHTQLIGRLRQEGYRGEMLDDFENRLGTVRQGFFERGLLYQHTQLKARAGHEITDITTAASQYAANNPNDYATARDMVRNSVREHPDLTPEERGTLGDQSLAVVRDAGARALAIQNPQMVIDTFDPHGLTAPSPPPSATTPSAGETFTSAPGADRIMNYQARAHGFQSVPAEVQTLGQASDFATHVNQAGVPSSAMGLFQITGDTLRDFAPRVFGTDWRNHPFDPTSQEQVAEAIFNSAKGDATALHNRWSSLTVAEAERVRHLPWAQASVEIMRGESGGSARTEVAATTPVREGAPISGGSQLTPDIQPVDLPASQSPPAPLVPRTMAVPNPVGLRTPGNIDLSARPTVHNADGSISTVRSISVGTDQGEVLIPTVVGDRVVSNEEAIRHYHQTGEHLGIFDTEANATAYAQQLHEEQAQTYTGGQAPAHDISGIHTGNALLDDLNGRERLQLLGLAREQLNRVNVATRAQMDVTIQNITAEALNNGGEIATPMPTEQQVLQAYPGPEGPQKWAQLQTVHGVGQAMTAFRMQSATDIQAGLDHLRPTPGSPTYATQLQIYEHAQQAAQTLLTAREHDPAAYVMQYFPAVREAAQHGTAQYYAALDRAYQTLGIDTRTAPVMTTDASRQMAQQYQLMNASDRREFIRQNWSMGEDRFRRFVHGAEGTTLETDANIFGLLHNYPPAAGRSGIIFQDALIGRDAIAQDPARRPPPEAVTRQFRAEALNSIQFLDVSTSRAIQDATEGLYVQRGGNDAQGHLNAAGYREALRTVLGGNLPANMAHGRAQFGTILPPGISQEQFQSWIERQTPWTLSHAGGRRGLYYGDLRTVPSAQSIIDEGVFVMTSPGHYMIRMGSDGQPLMNSTGHQAIINILPRDVVAR